MMLCMQFRHVSSFLGTLTFKWKVRDSDVMGQCFSSWIKSWHIVSGYILNLVTACLWECVDVRGTLYRILVGCINSPDLTMHYRTRQNGFSFHEVSVGIWFSKMLWVVMKWKLWKFWNDFIYLYSKHNTKTETIQSLFKADYSITMQFQRGDGQRCIRMGITVLYWTLSFGR